MTNNGSVPDPRVDALETSPNRFFAGPRLVGLTLLGLALMRLAYLPFFCGVTDLAGDESYYWEWGRRPDWGYYSKPPLIGWLMGLVGWLTGDSEWGIRLAALACGTASLWFLQSLALKIFGARAALLVLLLAALTPANIALNLFFTIDAPLVLCWSAALLTFWRCVEQPGEGSRWLLLSLAVGVGSLAKQMMLVFPALMLLLIASTPALRPLMRRAGFWWSLLPPWLFLLPVLRWQQAHQWVTLGHMGHHFDADARAGVFGWLTRFLSFPASQAGLFTPVTWVLLMGCIFGAMWRWRSLETGRRVLVWFSGPPLLVFFALAMRQTINPNWPAVFYLSGMVLLAGHLTQAMDGNRRLVQSTLAVAGVMSLLACALPFAIPALGLSGHPRMDPFARLRGWSEAGHAAGAALAEVPHPERTFVLALGHRENASQFAFYTPQHPPVYRWQPDGAVMSQYELWPDMSERAGWDALVLQPSEKPLAKSLQKRFASVVRQRDIHVDLGNGSARRWRVYLARTLAGPPR